MDDATNHPTDDPGTAVVAATIGVHTREAAAPGAPAGEGWWAITDAGARVFVPAGAVQGYLTLRNGQRVHLTLTRPDMAPAAGDPSDAGGAVHVLRATPPLG